MDASTVVWLYGTPAGRGRAQKLYRVLAEKARCLYLGPPGEPPPDLDLGPQPDLALALAACPDGLRPGVVIMLDGPDDPGGDVLPCPVLAWDGSVRATADAAAKAIEDGPVLPWLEHVQVNMPLRDLLGQYRGLVESSPVNLEIGIDAGVLDSFGPAEIDQVKAMIAGRRITLHLPFIDLVPASADPLVAAVAARRLSAAAEFAVEFGAVQAVGHLGYSEVMHRDLEAFVGLYAAAMAPVVRILDSGGCRLCLENTLELYCPPLLQCRQALAEAAGVAVGFCLDTGHAVSFSRTPLEQWWQAFAPDIWEMHLHDNDGSDDLHNPPGSGIVEWDFIARNITDLSRPPIFTLEPHTEAHFWASLRGLERVWGAPRS